MYSDFQRVLNEAEDEGGSLEVYEGKFNLYATSEDRSTKHVLKITSDDKEFRERIFEILDGEENVEYSVEERDEEDLLTILVD